MASLQPPPPGNCHNPHPKIRQGRNSTTSVTTPTSPRRALASDLTGIEGAAGTINIGYRGTFAFGKDGLSDVKFRKLTRILVHGKVKKDILFCGIVYLVFSMYIRCQSPKYEIGF